MNIFTIRRQSCIIVFAMLLNFVYLYYMLWYHHNHFQILHFEIQLYMLNPLQIKIPLFLFLFRLFAFTSSHHISIIISCNYTHESHVFRESNIIFKYYKIIVWFNPLILYDSLLLLRWYSVIYMFSSSILFISSWIFVSHLIMKLKYESFLLKYYFILHSPNDNHI